MDEKEESKTQCDTLYYDGQCPLCSREIQKLASYRKEDIVLVDINAMDSDASLPSTSFPSKSALMENLHLKTAEGKWIKGIDANIRAWRNTPFEKFWLLLRLPIIYQCASWFYTRWASWRLKNQQKRQ
ncbi:thiol-disulfide oxidoreductase DCC family protein [Agarilytica rhodophyticola]|uniref:thiol-disulfide oxidoreductase DCC family protein n=1 Tax=Agarilytica rhodophyticola TaxID=1737490 RepID=UPI000B3437D2|nr:DUF393 domain-containing protein [Agarilytica rhodophyticola]